ARQLVGDGSRDQRDVTVDREDGRPGDAGGAAEDAQAGEGDVGRLRHRLWHGPFFFGRGGGFVGEARPARRGAARVAHHHLIGAGRRGGGRRAERVLGNHLDLARSASNRQRRAFLEAASFDRHRRAARGG